MRPGFKKIIRTLICLTRQQQKSQNTQKDNLWKTELRFKKIPINTS